MKSGDHVYLDDNYAKRWRVTRVMKDCIWVVPECYGYHFPRGSSRKVLRVNAIKSFTS